MCMMFGEMWTVRGLLVLAGLARLLLVYYGRIHDYMFEVKFTDLDYRVYSDAARYISQGMSPYTRATYRYSPVLAWILQPNMHYAEFGKILFISADVLVGWLLYVLCTRQLTNEHRTATVSPAYIHSISVRAMCLWLFNPCTAIISARGNADVLVCALVLLTLYAITGEESMGWAKLLLAATIHGAGAVHLKIYPVIYLPSIYLYLSPRIVMNRESISARALFNHVYSLLNLRSILFCLTSLSTCVFSFWLCYLWCGQVFVDEALLYHAHRSDIRHNFSPYFLPLYLAADSQMLMRLISWVAFAPQLILVVLFAFKYAQSNLPLCWFLSTFAFVSFNKVCTSQYFVWYLCLLPLLYAQLASHKTTRHYLGGVGPLWALAWVGAQGVWLGAAYLLEFQGHNVFVLVWMASLLLLAVNACIMRSIIHVFETKAKIE